MASRSITVGGHEIPRRRFTRFALWYFLGLVALPILAVGLALDVLLYVVAEHWLKTCYGVLCLLR
ncbi:MAG: hypothetical protein IT563_18720 [Alphaproteobacteria bacterium]|nr:hypothetical protein [Alphaproteobacteria bacterium]